MTHEMKMTALGLSAGLGALWITGCVLQIGPGGSGGSAGNEQAATTSATTSAGAGAGNATSGGSGGSGGGADAFAGIDPEVLNRASLKASALSYNMFGLINSSGLDPSIVDQATIDALASQLAPTAEATVNTWLATLNSSMTQTAGNEPNWECTDKFKWVQIPVCMVVPVPVPVPVPEVFVMPFDHERLDVYRVALEFIV
ncbi:MAG: hypothetical protein ABI134_10330, partial [Byssovorax sp.]